MVRRGGRGDTGGPCVGTVQVPLPVKVSVSVSAQDGILALGKAHTRSAPSLSSLPKVALEKVPIFAWLNTDRSRPWKVECWPLPFSTPLSFRRSVLCCSGQSMFGKFLKPTMDSFTVRGDSGGHIQGDTAHKMTPVDSMRM